MKSLLESMKEGGRVYLGGTIRLILLLCANMALGEVALSQTVQKDIPFTPTTDSYVWDEISRQSDAKFDINKIMGGTCGQNYLEGLKECRDFFDSEVQKKCLDNTFEIAKICYSKMTRAQDSLSMIDSMSTYRYRNYSQFKANEMDIVLNSASSSVQKSLTLFFLDPCMAKNED